MRWREGRDKEQCQGVKGLSRVKEEVTVCRQSQEDCAVRTCLGTNGIGEESGT